MKGLGSQATEKGRYIDRLVAIEPSIKKYTANVINCSPYTFPVSGNASHLVVFWLHLANYISPYSYKCAYKNS